ncbi:hypothetical protein QCA50_005046 [Cerrena zonata]|uniref:ENTH domain-containing protein n=1 Tax=Cerrena zonata TaxID=2478898 RepID=A0AAW0GP20_9APHY
MLPLKNLRRIAKHVARGFSEVQSKARAATSNDPHTPSSKQIEELLRMSFRGDLCDELMETLFKRLEERGKSWRHVYKALIVVDHLLHAGSERALSCCLKNIPTFETLSKFAFVESDGTNRGIEVGRKASEILRLLHDPHSLNEKRRARPILKTTKSSPSLVTSLPLRKASLLDPTFIDVDVGSGSGSIHMDVGAVDMVFGNVSGADAGTDDENRGRRGELGSEASRSRGSSTAPFDPEVILIIDHRGLGFCAREGDMCGEGDAWVSELDTVSETEQQEGEDERDGDSQDGHSLAEVERWLESSLHSRPLSINSFHSIQSYDSRGTHSSWFASRLSIQRHSHDDDSHGSEDNDDDDDSDTNDDDQRRHEEMVILPRPSAPTPGLSPTRDSQGSSSIMSTRPPNTPATPAKPLASTSPVSPNRPAYNSSRHHHCRDYSNPSSPSKRSIRPLPTPPTSPRRSTEPEPQSDSETSSVNESNTEFERLKALRKLHSALPLDEAEIPKILSTHKGKRKLRPLPAVPGLVDLSSHPLASLLDYFPPVPSYIPHSYRI